MRIAPWTEVAVDLIGTWKIKVNGRVVEFNALTYIDTASNLVEPIRINEQSSVHVTEKFKQVWLVRYPLIKCCVQFTGDSFQCLLTHLNIRYSIYKQTSEIDLNLRENVPNS